MEELTPGETLLFNIPLPTALSRILSGRPQLKYHEAGMDRGLSRDSFDSFMQYQRLIQREFARMQREYGFTLINGNRSIRSIPRELTARVERLLETPHDDNEP